VSANDTRRRFRIVLVGIVLYVVLDAVAQLLPPHYSPISQAESDLAVGPYGFVMAANFVNRGLLSLEFIFALIGTVKIAGDPLSRYRGGLYLLGVWAVGALLLAVFPTDVPSTPVSWHGAIHLVVAILAFLGGAFGALSISLRMRESKSKTLRSMSRFALPIALVAVLFCLIELGGPFVTPRVAAHFGGLIERTFLGSVLVWMASISVYAIRHPEAQT